MATERTPVSPTTRPTRPRTPRPTAEVIPAGSDGEFRFTSSAGDVTVPSMSAVEPTFAIIEAVKANDNLGVIIESVKNCADAKSLAIVRKLRWTELEQFYTEWSAFSGISAGE